MEQEFSFAQQLKIAMIAAGITTLIGVIAASGTYLYRVPTEIRTLNREANVALIQVEARRDRFKVEGEDANKAVKALEERARVLVAADGPLRRRSIVGKTYDLCIDKQLEIATDEGKFQVEAISSTDLAANLMTA